MIKKQWTFTNTPKPPGLPPIKPTIVQLIMRMTQENRWGHRKLEGELKKLGYSISDEAVRKLLSHHHIPPVPERKATSSWRTFLNQH